MITAIGEADLRDVPNLPGYTLRNPEQRHRKSQKWGFINGQRMEFQEGLTHDRPKFVKAPKDPQGWRDGSLPQSTTREHMKIDMKDYDELPAWDALDRHVLRFEGFFKEAVVETNLENYRVRRCIVLYYLEDDTMHVLEPKIDNSGFPNGDLIRRHRFPLEDGKYIDPTMLVVGQELTIYGRTIYMCDCDAFTREYYLSSIGFEQGPPMDVPDDVFAHTRKDIDYRDATRTDPSGEKVFREAMLGGANTNPGLGQFLENDRKVCRFFAILDDLLTAQFERRPFLILFFLKDDTIQVREQYPLNCGRDNFPVFFKKGKVSKNNNWVLKPGELPSKDDFYTLKDLYVGQTVEILAQKFFIYDADAFTRMYFKDQMGIELAPAQDVKLPALPIPRPPTPPYTGFGSWDDSMTSVTQLNPKPPKKDFFKAVDNDGKILRFTAKFLNAKPEDVERRFVMCYYLADDTLAIHEPPQRNLGIVTGKFLEKGVHLNQSTGKLLVPRDLETGNTVTIFNHQFQMLDMDDYTRKWFDQQEPDYPNVDLQSIFLRLRDSMRTQFPLVRDVFRKFDGDHNGVMTYPEFRTVLRKFNYHLSEAEILAIMRHFDGAKDGQVGYNEFCDALLDEDYHTKAMKDEPRVKVAIDEAFRERAAQKMLDRMEMENVRRAAQSLSDIFYKRTGVVMKLYKEVGKMTHTPWATAQQIQTALLRVGFSLELEDVERTVLYLGMDPDRIDYYEFVQGLIAGYHDLALPR